MINSMHFKWKNSNLHDALRNNRQTGLSSGTKFLDIERTVLEKGVTAVALEICLLVEESIGGSLM